MKYTLLVAGIITLAARGNAATCSANPELCDLTVTSTIEQADLDRAVDVVLLGDGFTTASSWHTKANNAINTIKTQSATTIYGAVPNVYNFHIVDVLSATTNVGNSDITDTALGMNTSGDCGYTCIKVNSGKAALAALNAPDVDLIISIANSSSGRANASYASQLASGGSIRLAGLSAISHEMGHAVIRLADEYTESALCSSPSSHSLVWDRNVTADSSCHKFSTTAGAGCVQGGKYCTTGVWRSASGCLMRNSGNTAPCPVCERTIEQILLEKRTGLDVAEPWAVAYSPAAGATVRGSVTLSAGVFDDWFTPVHVSFVVDGIFAGTVATSGSSASLVFDTRAVPDGNHTLSVFAEDSAGHAISGLGTNFVSDNAPSSGTIDVNITYPTDGASVSGVSYVFATISGDGSAQQALLYVDGVVTDLTSGPGMSGASLSWQTGLVAPGSHTLVVAVRDAGDVEHASTPITVTIDDSTGCGAPGGGSGKGIQGEGGCVQINSPQPWATVSALLDLRYQVSETMQLPANARLLVDGLAIAPNPLATVAEPTQQLFIDATSWALGPHTLEVEVDDGSTVSTGGPVAFVKIAPPSEPLAYLHLPAGTGTYACGGVAVFLSGEDDVGITELALLDNGVLSDLAPTVPGTVTWNATTAAPGMHQLQAIATDADGNVGYSTLRGIMGDCVPPTVTITEPGDGDTVAADVIAVKVDGTDSGSRIDHYELYVDGALRPLSQHLFAELTLGSHTLRVRAVDLAGNTGDSATITVNASDCATSGCDDGIACTTEVCSPIGRCIYSSVAGCCNDASDCEDQNACTTDTCDVDTCSNASIADCCLYGSMCDDNDNTTMDLCSGPGGTCSNPPHERCDGPGECDDGVACTTDDCVAAPNGYCVHDRAAGCCDIDADCDDGDPCTTHSCNAGTCVAVAIVGCCTTSNDCDDADDCTKEACNNNACSSTVIPDCCLSDPECTAHNPCATSSCNASLHRCLEAPIASCCTFDFECEDWDPCTVGQCDAATCSFVDSGLCCSQPSDCDDSDPCTTEDCDLDGLCQHTAIAGCCVDATPCDDDDLCTADTCATNQCLNTAITDCCLTPSDCDDSNICTTDACNANTCEVGLIGGCCIDATDCDDGLACTVNTCESNACVTTPVPDCCANASDCDDSDSCTTDVCDAGSCRMDLIPGCCSDDAQCNDGSICTTNTCVSGACIDTPLIGCCISADDCDDADPCTSDACISSTCEYSNTCADGGPLDDGVSRDDGQMAGDAASPGDADPGSEGPSELPGLTADGGCACGQSGGGSLSLLLLIGLASPRRRWRLWPPR